jgi:hypothetical protein
MCVAFASFWESAVVHGRNFPDLTQHPNACPAPRGAICKAVGKSSGILNSALDKSAGLAKFVPIPSFAL